MASNKIIKNVGFLYLKMGVTVFLSLYTTRLVLNSLGEVDFGIFNVVGGVIAMLSFINNSMASVTQRFMSYSEGEGDIEKKRKIFNVSIVLHLIIGIVTCIGFILLSSIFFNSILNIPFDRMHAAEVVYAGLIVSTVFSMFSVPYEAVINAHEDMGYYAVMGIVESLMRLGIAFLITLSFPDKLIIYGLLMPMVTICSLVIMRIFCHHRYAECIIRIRQYTDLSLLKSMAKFAGWSLLGVSSSMCGYYGGSIVLNHFFGAVINTASGIATQISGQMLSLTNNMLKAINPVIAVNEGHGDRNQMINLSLRGCRFSYYLLAIFAIPAIVKMPEILSFWLSDVPTWAVSFTRLITIKNLIEQSTLVLGTSMLAIGNISKFNSITSIINLTPIVFAIFLFHNGAPPNTIYILQMIAYGIIVCALRIFFMKKYSGMTYLTYFREVAYPILKVTIISILFSVLLSHFVKWDLMSITFMILFNFLIIILFGIKKVERLFLYEKLQHIQKISAYIRHK